MNIPQTAIPPTSLISPQDTGFALTTFSRIAFIREFEAKALALTQANPPRVMGSMHFCAGQEAIALGAVAALHEEDPILATYRGHGWAIAAGLDPTSIMAEICHRKADLNEGRAGSAYFMAPHTRFIGENSIVGAGTTIACGVALASQLKATHHVAVVSIGDGAMNQGAVHEAMAFAAARKLAVIFVCENNGWSELTPTEAMFTINRLAIRGNAYAIPSATIDGTDPLAVRDSFKLAAERCRAGAGPALIECKAPRLWGHYHRDIEHYRSKADKQEALSRDPLDILANRLIASGLATHHEVETIHQKQRQAVEEMTEAILRGPSPEPVEATCHVVAAVVPGDRKLPSEEVRTMTYVEAVNAALRTILAGDSDAILYGEDVGKPGGVFGAAKNLQREFGPERVFDTPISENAILGSAVGAALRGLKPIIEIMWADFLFVALDQLVNQAANVRYITGGRSHVPLLVRTQQGATAGSCAQHSQSIEAILAHVPGIKVALAATPSDAYALLRSAAADSDPCVIIEHRSLYQVSGPVTISEDIEPIGLARLHRNGTHAALVTWGAMLPKALAAAEELASTGIDVAVLDLRWLSLLDEEALRNIAMHCGGKVLIAHEAVKTGGFGAEVYARLQELCADTISLSIRRLATPDVRIPAVPSLQAALIPSAADIVTAVQDLVHPKKGAKGAA